MRVLLFTGKGGVGKTTVAAATAVHAARRGIRTMICSTDAAHSLSDALDEELGDDVRTITPLLDGVQLDARRRLEDSWSAVREYLMAVFSWAGAAPVDAEELAVLPGLDEAFALTDIQTYATSGEYELIVVDCAPTAETLRLLSLPHVLSWYVQRVFPEQRRATNALRPLIEKLVSVPVARDEVFEAVQAFAAKLDGVRALLTDPEVSSARIVVQPERVVVAEARRMYTYLSLFGYSVDAVIANRLLPAEISDAWFAPRLDAQAEMLAEIADAFAPLPVLQTRMTAHEPVGCDRLGALGSTLYHSCEPDEQLARQRPFSIDAVDRSLVLSLHLPMVDKRDIELGRRNGDLLVAVGPHRRAVSLPDSLQRREVSGARIEGDRLRVEFVEV
jgi:arsenite-transporting ATPase